MTAPTTTDQRAALQRVTAAAIAALLRVWPSLQLNDADATRAALRGLVASLTDEYGTAAATLAVDVYTVLRADAGPSSVFTPQIPDLASTDVINRTVGWSVGPLYSSDPQPKVALQRVSGGLQKLVADGYRDTIQDASMADPAAHGWQRDARPGACPFCTMLAARGAVYSEKSVDFGAHRDCHCLAVPAFDGQAKPVQPYTPTDRNITSADRARVRRWIAAHH